MKIKNFIDFVDKKYEGKSFSELKEAPVSAISGVTAEDEKLLKEAFNIKTISDLAKFKFVVWAQMICTLAESEEETT